LSRGFSKSFHCRPAGSGGEERGKTPTRWAIPRRPLRDSQEEPPRWLCPLCGAEQYCLDRGELWRGRRICAVCLSRLEKEKEEEDET